MLGLMRTHVGNSANVMLEGGREASSKPLRIIDVLTAIRVQTQLHVLEVAGDLKPDNVVLGKGSSLDGTRGSVADSQSQLQEDRRKHAEGEDEIWNVMQFC
jgi:hypothetical protein